MPFYEHSGHSLYYETIGSGERDVVLMHGILMDTDVNRDLAERLAKSGYRVHLVDFLGHGRSDKPDDISHLRMDRYAAQAVGLLDHLGVKRAIFGGVSLGAIVALQVGVKFHDRIEALVIEMPVLENAVPGIVVLLAPLLFAARFLAKPLSVVTRSIARLPEGGNVGYRSFRVVFGNEPRAIANILSGALVGPIAPTLDERRAITVPTLVIGHPHDALHPFTDAEQLSRQMPFARFVQANSILELRTSPSRLVAIIERFLESAPRPIETKARRRATAS